MALRILVQVRSNQGQYNISLTCLNLNQTKSSWKQSSGVAFCDSASTKSLPSYYLLSLEPTMTCLWSIFNAELNFKLHSLSTCSVNMGHTFLPHMIPTTQFYYFPHATIFLANFRLLSNTLSCKLGSRSK